MTIDRRAINDDRRRTFGDEAEHRIVFICECVDERCLRAVSLTAVEFDDVRASGGAVVDPSHQPPAAR